MNPDYQEQARRLNEIRTYAGQGSLGGGNGSLSAKGHSGEKLSYSDQRWADTQPVHDPLIYQGVYAPSGFDMLDILLRVYSRPNPQIEIGNVDSAVALILCDADDQNHPIVYCSEPFQTLTGYSSAEVLGQNCRFLQNPPGGRCSDRNILHANSVAKREVKNDISKGRESRVRFTNFRKDGSAFRNILTLIPIHWEGKNYVVGFQADEGTLYR